MDRSSIYRERFALTLEHQPVDRCPIDLGGTPQSSFNEWEGVERLAEYLGFAGPRPDDYDKMDRRILEHWDIDLRRCGNIVPFTTKYNRTPSESAVVDCFGMIYKFSGLYWEIADGPLRGADEDAVAAYEFPALDEIVPGTLEVWAGIAEKLMRDTPYVVVGEHPVFGVLELACWLCGYDHIMLMLALDPDFIHLLFGKILEFQKMVIREYYGRLGAHIHLTTSGDDFGTQKGLFMSPGMWREFVKPYMRERIAYTAKFTDAVYMHHSCGGIFDIIPDLIEIGVRILNPIQPAAVGMDPSGLKSAYGKDIVFHGGLDTQKALPSNDMHKIQEAVDHLLSAMHPSLDGGYIFAPAHNLQSDVSPMAVAAMYDAVYRESN